MVRDQSTAPQSSDLAENLTGAHLADLRGLRQTIRIRDLLGDELAEIAVDWHRQTIGHGRDIPENDPDRPGKIRATVNPSALDMMTVPVELIREYLADHDIAIPTRRECRDWAEADRRCGGDGVDPELELNRARLVVDPDLTTPTGPAEKRICGVPQSIYDSLEPHEQAKVIAGNVIPGPKVPLAVARYLMRHHFAARGRLPGRGRAWMRTVVRIDQTWYEYASRRPDEPPRWIARADPEWMPAQLQRLLGDFSYIRTRRENKQNVYEIKWWNPDSRSLGEVEKALMSLLPSSGSSTHAHELPDLYGNQHHAYPNSQRWVLCRNGVLDTSTGQVERATPLWFSLTRIDAEYNHRADPYAECRWLDTLRAQWDDDRDAITCLQQWFGYVLSGRNDLQRWMMVLGPKGSAKSLIANVLHALIGNAAELGLDALNSHFGLQQAYESGSTLALMSDMRFGGRDTSMAVGRLLAITGGDIVDIPRKYKASVPADLPIRFHGSANDMPRISDHTGALLSRMLILETTQVFRGTDRDDPGLSRHILSMELGQVLRWAIEGLALLNAANGKFTLSARADELRDETADGMSNVRQFVRGCCEIGDENDYVDLGALFKVWGMWAKENKTGERMSQSAFRGALKSLGGDPGTPIRPGQKRKPNDEPGKWLVVYGVKRASTVEVFTDRGVTMTRTVSTDDAELVRDPFD